MEVKLVMEESEGIEEEGCWEALVPLRASDPRVDESASGPSLLGVSHRQNARRKA